MNGASYNQSGHRDPDFVPPGNSGTEHDPLELRVTAADKLVGLALNQAVLFATVSDAAWAAVQIQGRRETHALTSKSFKYWLVNEYYKLVGCAPAPSALAQALLTLEAKARCDGSVNDVYVRRGTLNGRLYLDLADEHWQAVEVDRDGWRIVTQPPIYFRRPRGMLPLPLPEPGGKIADLRPFLNLAGDDDWNLIVAWLLAALRPVGPYPLLVLAGEPGSAKSTTARILRNLIDPNVSALRSAPRDERDCWIAASNAGALAFDNLSTIPTWLSDALCRVASGGGFATRQLHTDDDEMLFEAVCPVILTAVGDVVVQSDLADRSILIELPTITKRRSETSIRKEFAEVLPRILGALLDAVVHGLREVDDVKLDGLPRLADFVVWAAACEGAYAEAGTTMEALQRNASEAVASVMESDAVCVAVLTFLESKAGHWKGRPQALLAEIGHLAPAGALQDRSWPRTPQTLSNRLRLAMPNLRKLGVRVHKAKSNGSRYIELQRD